MNTKLKYTNRRFSKSIIVFFPFCNSIIMFGFLKSFFRFFSNLSTNSEIISGAAIFLLLLLDLENHFLFLRLRKIFYHLSDSFQAFVNLWLANCIRNPNCIVISKRYSRDSGYQILFQKMGTKELAF